MNWFLGAIVVWLVGWAIWEHWLSRRRLKRDRYADYNGGR